MNSLEKTEENIQKHHQMELNVQKDLMDSKKLFEDDYNEKS